MNAENYIRNMSVALGRRNRKEKGRRRASAQLLLPWVDEMPNTYTHDVRTVNTERWVFNGYLMESRETGVWGTVEVLQIPENKGFGIFDGYLIQREDCGPQSAAVLVECSRNWPCSRRREHRFVREHRTGIPTKLLGSSLARPSLLRSKLPKLMSALVSLKKSIKPKGEK